MVIYNSIYEGGNYSLDKKYSIVVGSQYQSPVSSFALALDPRTSNQLKETTDKLNTGAKMLEIQGTFSKQLESIPDQHLDEIRRQAKLVGSKLTFHGPLEEPSGFDGQKNEWQEEKRKQVESQFNQALERAHKLDPDGNIIVTLHSTAQLPEMLQREKIDGKEKITSFFAVDSISGKVQLMKDEKSEFPESKEGKMQIFDPKKQIERINKEAWDQQLFNFAYHMDLAENRMGHSLQGVPSNMRELVYEVQEKVNQGQLTLKDIEKSDPHLAPYIRDGGGDAGLIYLRNSYNDLKGLFNYAYKSVEKAGNKNDLKKLDEFRKEVQQNYEQIEKNNQGALSKVVHNGLEVLKNLDEKPKIFKPFNEFVIDKSSDTFANVASNVYKKFGNSAPIISIENPPAGGGLSRAEDLKQLIESSREKFIKKLQSDGHTKTESKAIAEKLIGATWDVGHINMIRKYGYDDKDLLKEAKTIKPFLKHIHLSDNFGFEHTELPMGMGNVPLKETAKIFGKKFNKLSKAIETGDWYQHFQVSPFNYELAAFGSPLSSGGGANWSQASWGYAPYFSGYGTVNPEIHHSIYGRGFTSLPAELGGQIPGAQGSRATGGTPLA